MKGLQGAVETKGFQLSWVHAVCLGLALLGLRSGAAQAQALVPPTIMKSFGTEYLRLGGSTSLTFTLNNPNTSAALTGVGFTDSLPAGLVVSTPNVLSGSCGGGTIVATAGSGAVTLTGATLAASASCTFSMSVKGTTEGTKNNSTGMVTSAEGGTGGTASASVSVGITAPATTIPALSPWALGVLSLLLIITAGIALRHKIG